MNGPPTWSSGPDAAGADGDGPAEADDDATGRSTIGASSRGGGGPELHDAHAVAMTRSATEARIPPSYAAAAGFLRYPPRPMDSRDLEFLAARRLRVALALTGVMLATYFGFLLLIAYDKPALGALVTPGLSVGILLGALVIVIAWVVTGIYVRWANRVYDVELARLREKKSQEE